MPITNTKSIVKSIKQISKPMSEAERLGIPKGMRSSKKSLEDPYYWGYQQWNQRYNDAIRFGNPEEVQRIRDLHFITKAPNIKAVDENGMPLHLYHGTGAKGLTVLDVNKRGSNTGNGYYKDPITNEKIPIDSENTFSLSTSKDVATSYKNLARWQEMENRKIYYENILAAIDNDRSMFTRLEGPAKDAQRHFIDNILSPKLGYDLRSALNNKTLDTSQIAKLRSQIETILKKVHTMPDARRVSNRRMNLNESIKDLNMVKQNKDKFLSGDFVSDYDFDNYNLHFVSGYGNRDQGEIYTWLSKENGKYKIDGEPVTKESLDRFIRNAEEAVRQQKNGLEEAERLGGYDKFGDVLDVYVNTKNPLIHDYNGSSFPDKYIVPAKLGERGAHNYIGATSPLSRSLLINGKEVPTGYIAARQVRKAMNSGNDAVVYKNIRDPFLSDTWGIFDPKRIKLADAITRDDSGKIISIIKRDNFHKLDDRYKSGGKIHIKKANKGKFTDYCGGKVTEACIRRGKNSSDPKIRRRATFADNARHWKH